MSVVGKPKGFKKQEAVRLPFHESVIKKLHSSFSISASEPEFFACAMLLGLLDMTKAPAKHLPGLTKKLFRLYGKWRGKTPSLLTCALEGSLKLLGIYQLEEVDAGNMKMEDVWLPPNFSKLEDRRRLQLIQKRRA